MYFFLINYGERGRKRDRGIEIILEREGEILMGRLYGWMK